MAKRAVTAAYAEGETSVGSGVGDRGHEERSRVGRLRADALSQQQVEQQVGQRAHHANRAEPQELRAIETSDATQVVDSSPHDVDAAVRVVDPVHWHLVNSQPRSFGEDE